MALKINLLRKHRHALSGHVSCITGRPMTAVALFLAPSRPAVRLGALLKRVPPGMAVFIGVMLLRLLVLFRSTDTLHFLPTQGDMKFYSDWALRIVGGQWTDHQAFYGLPLYAYLLAGLYALIGFQPYVALLLQAVAEGAIGWLIFRLAPLAFADPTETAETAPRDEDHHPRQTSLIGAAAALGWALFVPAQAYSTILMPTTYFVAAFWFVIWWTLRERKSPLRAREFFLMGLFMGFVAMMVANILFLSGVVVAALCCKRSWVAALPAARAARWRLRVVAAILLCGGIGLGAAPCWIHNYFVAGEPVLLSAHSGINFWIGNNPEANGYPKVPGGMRADQEGLLRDSITFAQRHTGRPLRRFEVSAYWSAQAHAWIAGHPVEFVELLGVKLGNFWSAYQYDDLGVILPMQEDGVLLPGIGFGVVASLGLPGLLLAAARRPRARWLIAAVLLHMASLMSVFVTERYRMAAVPGLLLLGSFGVFEMVRLLSGRRWVPAATFAVLLVGIGILVNRTPADSDLLCLDDYNTGVADLENRHFARARPKLERVLARKPDNAEAVFAMGNLSLAENRYNEAAHYYQRTLELDPMHHRAMNNLGVLAMQNKQWQAAQTLFVRAMEFAPQDAKLNYLLARTRIALNDPVGAGLAIDNALRLDPRSAAYQKVRAELDRPAAAKPADSPAM